ncbi:extensin-like [Punica granatum]|uniref:Extensin-like n=1 Tax=Punica granatum TaxID=22663 RepID=A0A6P8DYF9_PUNGR|nr:extensin-like [Punica granatum]
MAEEDRVDISEEVNPSIPVHSQSPPTHAPPPSTPAGIFPAYSGAPPTHLPPPTSSGAPLPRVSLTSSASDDQARITELEGTVNQLVASMTANMAELFALLRGPNRASSSSTPPPGQGPTVDPTPWVPPTQIPENLDAPAPPTLHTSTAHPFTSPFPPPPAPTTVPLPPATFLSSEQAPSAPPLVSIPAPAAIYTVPPPMAEDIPTWAALFRKFIDQYQYCAKTPPTLLELSMKEMAQGQRFEEYATKWCAQVAKHIPPINEAQQI